MTKSSETLEVMVEATVRERERERRVLEEQRAAAARAAAYRDHGTWDDADWWALQLGRTVQPPEVAPPF